LLSSRFSPSLHLGYLFSSLWNERVLASAGVDVEAELIISRGIPMGAPKGSIREPDPVFSVTWIDTQGQRRTSSIKFSSRFAQEIIAKRATKVRIRYVPSDPSIKPVAVEDAGLVSEQAWYPFFGVLGTALSLALFKILRRRKSLVSQQGYAIHRLEAAEPEITASEWRELCTAPSDDLLRKL
jgi:hypothetical protein